MLSLLSLSLSSTGKFQSTKADQLLYKNRPPSSMSGRDYQFTLRTTTKKTSSTFSLSLFLLTTSITSNGSFPFHKTGCMGNGKITVSFGALTVMILLGLMPLQTNALMPFTRSPLSLWDWDTTDPFRILEQTPLTVPKGLETLALVHADWKETPSAHIISVDIPGIKRDDLKIEIEENRVLRVSGERKAEVEEEGDRWHRAERTVGKFWRQFRLPWNADMDGIRAHIENGVLRITVPKLAEEKKKQPKVVNIVEESSPGEDIKATKDEMRK